MGRKIALTVVAIIAALVVVFLLGPRPAADMRITFDPASIGDDLDAWVAGQEARYDDIQPGLQKEIVWADPATKSRTPLALVYVHGFSASRGEAAPLTELVAHELGANVFYTRLTGHGRDGAAMTDGSVNRWVNDLAEAIAIGRRIGDEVVIIAMSTGAGLTAWTATQPDLMNDVKGVVLMSPNFRVKAGGAWLLTMPWGAQLAKLVIGPERGFEPRNALQEQRWTYRYPTEALLPMAALVEKARKAKVENAVVPALFMFSDFDTVVDHSVTRQIADRWGAPHELEVVPPDSKADTHVIAGEAMSPSATEPYAARIAAWIRALP
ncbi:MAG: alpha/beta hydrolase [Rhizobiaceae bacterium]|nr:alpha/beta hydrolase [Rhizobiaceae bacterium]